jgi:hypothetical protein
MKTHFVMISISLALLVTQPSLAADCDQITTADLNSRIETNFTLMDSSATQDASTQNKIQALKQEFSEAGEVHNDALENNDQTKLNKACGMYQTILDEQAAMSE